MTDREQYIQGLREFADWLAANPTMPTPIGRRILISLDTNQDVLDFAERLDTDVTVDTEGNCSTDLTFAGGVAYHAYSYADFDAHCDAAAARNAQKYADRHNLALTPKIQENAA